MNIAAAGSLPGWEGLDSVLAAKHAEENALAFTSFTLL